MKFTISKLLVKDMDGSKGPYKVINILGSNGQWYGCYHNKTTSTWGVGMEVNLPDEYFVTRTYTKKDGTQGTATDIKFPKAGGFGGGVNTDVIMAKLNAIAADVAAIKDRLEQNSQPSQLTDEDVPF